MEILSDTTLSIPAMQMVLFVALISVFLLFGKRQLCILTTFIFTFYWGFVLNKEMFITRFGEAEKFMGIYFISGFVMVIIVIISFFIREE